jgi:AcrR family transcriptional regulator
MAKQKKTDDGSAEQKIKEAARKLFTEKGFDAVKTRDIAAEAGINLALLNYYFRSKEKLFDIIMIENFEQFIRQLIPVLGDERLSLEERLTQVVGRYIDMLELNPDLPFFIMNQMKNDPSKLFSVREKMWEVREKFISQLGLGLKEGKGAPIDVVHFMINFMGLIIFPFIARPMLMKVNSLDDKAFKRLMDERKKLVPVWLKAMMKAK